MGETNRQPDEGSARHLELALEGTADGWFDWEIPTGVIQGGDRLFTMLGYIPGALQRIDDWRALTHPDDLERVTQAISSHLRGKTQAYQAELRLRHADGSWRWILDRGRVTQLTPDGKPLRMTGLHSDITDRKELELRLQMSSHLASVGTLAAGLAHEISTPLAYLRTSLDALGAFLHAPELAPTAALERAHEALAMAREGADRVHQTVHDIRTFSRLNEGPRREAVDLREAAAQAIRMTRRELAQRARIVERYEPTPPAAATAPRLGQVLINILLNAAQAIPEGRRGEHEVIIHTFTLGDGRPAVEVSDTGCGISPEIAPRIFDPFFTTKPVGVGTGLGLPICHGILASLGGELSFRARPERGTTFRVVLPRHLDARAARVAEAPVSSRRLLVIDDHLAMGQSLKLLLSEHQVECTASGEEALRLLREAAGWDLVLCDVNMPELSGVELCEEVARFAPELAGRFVFMTGGLVSADHQSRLERRGARVLYKPFPPEELRRLIGAL